MKVRVRYLGYEIAEQFGSKEKREVLQLPNSATYKELLSLLGEKYGKAKSAEEMFDTFFFICGGKPLNAIRDESIDPDMEVLVAHKVFGG